MTTNRLEAFSDGIMAIIITIMVLDLKVPFGDGLMSLKPYLPKFIYYFFSFIYVGVYWNNHHHLFQAIQKVSGGILWSNLHLMFWLSLLPVTTAWMGEHFHSSWPVAVYGFVLLMCSIAFIIIEKVAIKSEGSNSILKRSVKNQWKETISIIGNITGITLSFYLPEAGLIIFYLIAILWWIPDKRIGKSLQN